MAGVVCFLGTLVRWCVLFRDARFGPKGNRTFWGSPRRFFESEKTLIWGAPPSIFGVITRLGCVSSFLRSFLDGVIFLGTLFGWLVF